MAIAYFLSLAEAETLEVAFVVEEDETSRPVEESLAEGGEVAARAEGVGEPIEQFRRPRFKEGSGGKRRCHGGVLLRSARGELYTQQAEKAREKVERFCLTRGRAGGKDRSTAPGIGRRAVRIRCGATEIGRRHRDR